MEFEARSELVLNDDSTGGLVTRDAQFEERRLEGASAGPKKDSRSLYEQIAEQRSAAEELKKAGASQAFKPRGLDEEEAEFLEQQEDNRRLREESTATQEELDRRSFELAVAMRQAAARAPAKRPVAALPGASSAVFSKPPAEQGVATAPAKRPVATLPSKPPAEQGVAAASSLSSRLPLSGALSKPTRAGDQGAISNHSADAIAGQKRAREPSSSAPPPPPLALLGAPSHAPQAPVALRPPATKAAAAPPPASLVAYDSADDDDD